MAAIIAPCKGAALRRAAVTSSTASLPGFLVPAWQSGSPRQFSATTNRPSKLGRTPIAIPPEVEVSITEPISKRLVTSWQESTKKVITVKGPLATLTLDVPDFVQLQHNEDAKTVMLNVADANVKNQREMWGTSWAYLNNYVTGVSEGHTAILRLVGVGYRASVEQRGAKEEYPGQKFLCLKLGFTHPVEEGIPKGVKVTTPQPTRILLEGPDRETLMAFAGRVRLWRKPEPYKGKGVFINDETIKLKSKKIS